MNATLKLLAVLLIVAMNIEVFGPIVQPQPMRLEAPHPGDHHFQSAGPNYKLRMILGVFNLAAVTFFVIDAFRRTYEGPRGRALGFALGGYLSFGLSSLIYFVFWGWRPSQKPEAVYGKAEFCPACLMASTHEEAPDSEMYEIGVGSLFLGDAERCATCQARIKTLWAWYIVPLYPLGSYRVIPTAMGRYVGRRTHVCWRQVLSVYIVGLALCGPIFLWVFGVISFSR